MILDSNPSIIKKKKGRKEGKERSVKREGGKTTIIVPFNGSIFCYQMIINILDLFLFSV
jgi:hypothetical protein